MDRGERYEDPLDAFLKANGLGEVSGGGTQLLETGEIEVLRGGARSDQRRA